MTAWYADDALEGLTHLNVANFSRPPRRIVKNTTSRIDRPARQPPMLINDQLQDFQNFLDSDMTNEVEISLGTYSGDRFISGVQLVQFHNIIKFMKEQSSVSQEPLEVTKEYRSGFLRKIVYDDGSIIYQKKVNQKSIDSRAWFFRIRNSKEENIFEPTLEEVESLNFSDETIKKGVAVKEANNRVIRFKNRYSFLGYENSIFDGVRVDLTFVIQDNGINVRKVYEVEIERTKILRRGSAATYTYLRLVKLLLMIAQDILIIPPHMNEQDEIILDGEDLLLTSTEINKIARTYNQLFNTDIRNRQLEMRPGQFYECKNKPKAVGVKDLLNPSVFAITVKYDGLRKFLYIGNEGSYLVEPRYIIKKIVGHSEGLAGTLLDGELMTHEILPSFYVFDILFAKGEDVRSFDLNRRLEYLDDVIKGLTFGNVAIYQKKFFTEHDFYKSAALANEEEKITMDEKGIPTDGWILQPKSLPYKNERTLKWKPEDLLTIDFYLEIQEGTTNSYALFVKARKELELFKGTHTMPFEGIITINSKFTPQELNAHVVEMKWEDGTFIPLRVRYDRPDPNFKDWAIDLWKDIQNPIPKETLLGTDLRVVRNWFNTMKRNTLSTTLMYNEILIDVGSGRGGDLGKWKAKNVHVFAVEPDREVVKEMKRRQAVIKYDKVSYIPSGIENTDLITTFMKEYAKMHNYIEWRADNASAFFSMQFLGGSKTTMNSMIATFKKTLKADAKVVGIVMDDKAVKELLSLSDKYTSPGGAWSIEKGSEWPESSFGKEIIVNIKDSTSMVHNVKEYIFDFEEFSNKMKRAGFKLENTGFYKPPAHLPEDSKEWINLQRFFSFRKNRDIAFTQLQMLPMDQISEFASVFEKEELYRIGTVGEGSCFFHGILRAFSKRYINMGLDDELTYNVEKRRKEKDKKLEAVRRRKNYEELAIEIKKDYAEGLRQHKMKNKSIAEERMKFVSVVRQKLAQRLDFNTYTRLGNGNLAEMMTQMYQSRARNLPDAEKLGWIIYLRKLSSCSEWVGEEAIEYVSDTLGIDIYIMRDTTRNVYPLGADCNSIYKGRPSVVLLNLDNIHYETVAKKDKEGELHTIFNPQDRWIKKLYKKLCT